MRLHGVEEYPGIGLGLATVRKAIELMGGHVGVTSVPGAGSAFWIELAPWRKMRMKRVLLIDDNPADRDLLRRHLCRSFDAINCVEIFRRQDFEAALAQGGFDVVITDYHSNGLMDCRFSSSA